MLGKTGCGKVGTDGRGRRGQVLNGGRDGDGSGIAGEEGSGKFWNGMAGHGVAGVAGNGWVCSGW